MAPPKKAVAKALSDQTNQLSVQAPKRGGSAKATPSIGTAVTSTSQASKVSKTRTTTGQGQKAATKARQAAEAIVTPSHSTNVADEDDELTRLRRRIEQLEAEKRAAADSNGADAPGNVAHEKTATLTSATPGNRMPALPPKRRLQEKTSTALRTVMPRNESTTTREADINLGARDIDLSDDDGDDESTHHNNRGKAKPKKVKMIEEPHGEYSIQVAMHLAGSKEKNKLYNAIRRKVQDLTVRADLPWELPWSEMPTERLAMFYKAAREEVAWLARCKNDWATKALARQYMKNRRSDAYKKGTLTVPDKFRYLAANSAKRSASGSRIKKAELVRAEKESRAAIEASEDGGFNDLDPEFQDGDNDGPPRKKQRLSMSTNASNRAPQLPRARPVRNNHEFVQGSSRDQSPGWDARPVEDNEYIPGLDSSEPEDEDDA